jgi:hypothetical protein
MCCHLFRVAKLIDDDRFGHVVSSIFLNSVLNQGLSCDESNVALHLMVNLALHNYSTEFVCFGTKIVEVDDETQSKRQLILVLLVVGLNNGNDIIDQFVTPELNYRFKMAFIKFDGYHFNISPTL